MESRWNLYVMISQTPTKIGRIIRTFGRVQYNHSSLSLDPELKNLYSFARRQYNNVMVGNLVHETIRRYTLGSVKEVPVAIFKIPVTLGQYFEVKHEITRIQNDTRYRYNFFSDISYPITGGFETDKAYSCCEFVLHILERVGVYTDKKHYNFRPDDFSEMLKDYLYYEGNLLDYVPDDIEDPDFFAPFSRGIFKDTAVTFVELTRRMFTHKARR